MPCWDSTLLAHMNTTSRQEPVIPGRNLDRQHYTLLDIKKVKPCWHTKRTKLTVPWANNIPCRDTDTEYKFCWHTRTQLAGRNNACWDTRTGINHLIPLETRYFWMKQNFINLSHLASLGTTVQDNLTPSYYRRGPLYFIVACMCVLWVLVKPGKYQKFPAN